MRTCPGRAPTPNNLSWTYLGVRGTGPSVPALTLAVNVSSSEAVNVGLIRAAGPVGLLETSSRSSLPMEKWSRS
jgi:hypothetical protein